MAEPCILPVGREHLAALAELERLCFSEPWSETALALLLEGENVGFVIPEGDRALAYGGMTTVLDEGAVTNVATHPDRRGEGLGGRIVSALLEEAKRRGLRRVFLEVRLGNAPARHVYERAGFRPVGVRKNFYRHPTEDAILMEWDADGTGTE